MNSKEQPVALVTGAARRIGAAVARHLHANGFRVVVHCRSSIDAARVLVDELNEIRADSAHVVAADLLEVRACVTLANEAMRRWNRLDLLVNNASTFYPTDVGRTTEEDWDDLLGSNLKAPYFLVQACLPALVNSHGCVINLVDIHARRPLEGHAVYSTAKAGLDMLTRALAKELAPAVRVNGVAPGAILWPESGLSESSREKIVERTPLKRTGTPEDIARTVLFLARSEFITGQIVAVDGGRSL